MSAAVTLQDLYDAIKAQDAAQVRRVLAAVPDLLVTSVAGHPTPIQLAAYLGQSEIRQMLVAAKRDCDVHEAALLGDLSRLEELLAADATLVGTYSADGWTPLHLAAFFNQFEASALLIAQGASLRALSDNPMANTPLHAGLAGAADARLVATLLERGADPNAFGAQNCTPVHLAASRGDLAIVELLLAKGGNPLAPMTDGKTPVDLAAERGFPELAAKLRQAD